MTTADFGSFFAPLENDKPFVKFGLQGFAGSGKTYTSALIARGLHRHIGSTKPIAIFDTEKASKFLRPFFQEAGIPVVVKVSRSVLDLVTAIRLCEQGAADILLVDSISHVWDSHLAAYKRAAVARRRKVQPDQVTDADAMSYRIEFQDWGILKPTWKEKVSDPFVNAACHILMTGRAAWTYDQVETERADGSMKKEIQKSGVKMRVEGEMAYEPDVLINMDRVQELGKDESLSVWREATVLKDRSALLDGKLIRNPTFDSFRPIIDFLLSDAKAPEHRPESDDARMFDESDEARERRRQVTIVLEEIEGELVKHWPGQTAKDKSAKGNALESAFGTRSWTAITGYPLEGLRAGLDHIRGQVAGAVAAPAAEPEPPTAEPREDQVAAASDGARSAESYYSSSQQKWVPVRTMQTKHIESAVKKVEVGLLTGDLVDGHNGQAQLDALKGELARRAANGER